jgi:hypothetical protein
VAHEYGILMRSCAADLVGKEKDEFRGYLSNMRNDFHAVILKREREGKSERGSEQTHNACFE